MSIIPLIKISGVGLLLTLLLLPRNYTEETEITIIFLVAILLSFCATMAVL